MPNNAQVVNPLPPGTVTAGDPIPGIEVDASGSDTVDAPSSTVGTFKGGVYSPQAHLTLQAGTIYVPDSDVVAETGNFKIRAEVQFTSGAENVEVVPASHVGDFNGTLPGGQPSGRPRPREGRGGERPQARRGAAGRRAKPARKSAARPARKSAARPARKSKSRSAAKPPRKTKAGSAAKKRKAPAAKRGVKRKK